VALGGLHGRANGYSGARTVRIAHRMSFAFLGSHLPGAVSGPAPIRPIVRAGPGGKATLHSRHASLRKISRRLRHEIGRPRSTLAHDPAECGLLLWHPLRAEAVRGDFNSTLATLRAKPIPPKTSRRALISWCRVSAPEGAQCPSLALLRHGEDGARTSVFAAEPTGTSESDRTGITPDRVRPVLDGARSGGGAPHRHATRSFRCGEGWVSCRGRAGDRDGRRHRL
jgi:hypothetical protein